MSFRATLLAFSFLPIFSAALLANWPGETVANEVFTGPVEFIELEFDFPGQVYTAYVARLGEGSEGQSEFLIVFPEQRGRSPFPVERVYASGSRIEGELVSFDFVNTTDGDRISISLDPSQIETGGEATIVITDSGGSRKRIPGRFSVQDKRHVIPCETTLEPPSSPPGL